MEQNKNSRVSLRLRKRTTLIFLLFSLLFFAVFFRLFYLQVFAADDLAEKGKDQQMREVPVEAGRGTIYDRNGNILAVSVSVDSIYASPTEIDSEEAPDIAATLSEILGLDKETVLGKLTSGRAFEWIKRKVDEETAFQVKNAGLTGIGLTTETKRNYPNDILACHALGFVGIDNQGLEGLEAMEDTTLTGEDGYILAQYDSHGQEIAGSNQTYVEPTAGSSLVLTIDENIQYFCERELDALMSGSVNPKGATAIVMDPDTGEILALAVRPGYDPNHYGDYEAALWRNTAVSDFYEPGSVAKIMTISAALEEGVVDEDDRFYDPGYIMVGKVKIRCWSRTPHGSETFVEVAQNSCNPAFVQVGQRIDASDSRTFYRYLKSFGIGQLTGISLPGESAGSLQKLDEVEEVNAVDVANMYIGQGYGLTAIQLISAVSAAVNGGILREPQLVKSVLDSDGNIMEETGSKEVRRVISEKTSERVCNILENVVANGTGNKAYIEGYRVGGKTGTAQKFVNGTYSSSKYVASFIGAAPMDDPEIVCLVVIDEPGSYPIYGGTIAAPVCKRIMEDTLVYLGVEPQVSEADEKGEDEEKPETVMVPSVTGLSAEEAASLLEEANLKTRVTGSGDKVVAQTPAVLEEVTEGSTVVITLGSSKETSVILPDFTGKRLLEAGLIADALGLVFVYEGSGEAVSQDPAAGSAVQRGDVVTVTFKNKTGEEVTLSP
ncbi:MAG TPA: stage V sporulation protein D [Clostridiales bacterium]|nr:stage V sporulation protein D [Clostridiales bacterium]